jgi:hypothetical protein
MDIPMSEASAPYGLEGLLGAARDASPSDRIEFRDSIATHGEDAIVAMTDWLGEPRLAAFAIRVLERIGRQPETKQAVLEVFAAVDREELPAHLVGDVDQALAGLGGPRTPAKGRRSGSGSASRLPGTPGIEGRGYWVMRTSQWERPYIWSEAQRGRLRQGWGWNAEMNLETIAERVRLGSA